jgi:hypothetical protein
MREVSPCRWRPTSATATRPGSDATSVSVVDVSRRSSSAASDAAGHCACPLADRAWLVTRPTGSAALRTQILAGALGIVGSLVAGRHVLMIVLHGGLVYPAPPPAIRLAQITRRRQTPRAHVCRSKLRLVALWSAPMLTRGTAPRRLSSPKPSGGRLSGIPIQSAQGGKTRESKPAAIPTTAGPARGSPSRAISTWGFASSLPDRCSCLTKFD